MHDFSGYSEMKEWSGLKGIGMVHSFVTVNATGETYEEKRYCISSTLDIADF